MRNTLMRYPTTTIVALVGIFGLVVAAALFLSGGEGAQRLGLVIGIATLVINGLLNQAKTESAASAAIEVKEDVKNAIAEGSPRSDATLLALTEVLRRTEKKVDAVVKQTNGHSAGELHTRATDDT